MCFVVSPVENLLLGFKASHLHFFASVSISLFGERFSNDVVELPSNKGSFLLQSKYSLVSLIKHHYHLLMNFKDTLQELCWACFFKGFWQSIFKLFLFYYHIQISAVWFDWLFLIISAFSLAFEWYAALWCFIFLFTLYRIISHSDKPLPNLIGSVCEPSIFSYLTVLLAIKDWNCGEVETKLLYRICH